MKFSKKSLNKEAVVRWLKALSQNSVVRWWIVGLFFTFLNIPILYFFDKILPISSWLAGILHSERPERMPSWLALALASELVTILRFFVNDRWVFGYIFPTWQRLWQYHVANFGSFLIWFSVSLLLHYTFSVDTVLAGLIATVFSVGFSMVTNFLWIWREPKEGNVKSGSKNKKKKASNTNSLK
jgi:putative flippase GtrA